MVISGTVESIVFRNPENGYTVMDFVADDEWISVVGIFPELGAGSSLTLVGDFHDNPKYGRQFEATEVTLNAQTDLDGIYNYLSSGLICGVGESTAYDIVRHFGAQTLEVMEHEPERLREIKGIGRKRAARIAESFAKQNEQRAVIMALQAHEIPLWQCLRIYQTYGGEAMQILTENPYRMVGEIDGFGFLSADRIAMKMGISAESEFRYMAGILHVLKESAQSEGHTYLPQEMLLSETKKLLQTENEEKIERCIEIMLMNRRLVKFKGEEGVGIALTSHYRAENGIAGLLTKFAATVKKLDLDADDEIAHYEKTTGIHLNSEQVSAVQNALREGVMVITGGPGTGKTTIIRCIVSLMEERGLNVSLAAPTGRAAKRMSEATGREAKTIHRMLGVQSSEKHTQPRFKYNELNQMETDVVIVDEISMADIFIFHSLLVALPEGVRLVLVGDKDQLPSVSCGNVLGDILASKSVLSVYLTKIYRQDENSLIVENAHRINRGEMPLINNRSKDFFFIQREKEGIYHEILSLLKNRLPNFLGVAPTEIQVLSPVKKGVAGVENLNRGLQNILNENPNRAILGGTEFREGDKVMHIQNDYNLQWTREEESGEGVFNGDVGIVTGLTKRRIEVEFDDGRLAVYRRSDEFAELRVAYAVSVHKSQGSEFKAVVIALPNVHYLLMNRNLLYTAVTRARNAVVLVGTRGALERMVSNDYTVRRYTMLKELLWECKHKASLWS